jgi:polyvinyl alcohol dehydrogenase (cytochrome)
MHGPAGAPIWSTPTVDVEAGVIYAATGNSYSDVEQPGSNAVIAFDLESGAIHWKSQVREADNYVIGCPVGINCPEDPGPDFDFGSSPIIRALPDGGRILLVGDKGGVAYGLDPDAQGEVLWETKVGAGSALGGIQWGSAADEEVFYVAVSDYIGRPNERRPGLNALRIADGEVVWHTPAPAPSCSFAGAGCSNSLSAAISMIPGVIFSGSLDGYLRAFSSSDGSLLWGYDTARLYETVNGQLARGGSLDAGGPVIAGGMLFATSGYGRFGREPGNVLLAFSVGGR